MKINSSLVSVEWLQANLNLESLLILDASMSQVGTDSNEITIQEVIPNSHFFDLKGVFSDATSVFPSTIPTVAQFEAGARHLGISNNSLVIIYDNHGIYSSPRAWWLFKLMGFNNVAVLNGGLPAWKKSNFQVDKNHNKPLETGDFKPNFQKKLLISFEDLLNGSLNDSVIIDARSSDRFKGLQPEPRKGLSSGTIPNSINMPFTEVLNGYEILGESELKTIYNSKVIKKNRLIFSCGSGITACILSLAADVAGFTDYAVYDGSWTEYATMTTS